MSSTLTIFRSDHFDLWKKTTINAWGKLIFRTKIELIGEIDGIRTLSKICFRLSTNKCVPMVFLFTPFCSCRKYEYDWDSCSEWCQFIFEFNFIRSNLFNRKIKKWEKDCELREFFILQRPQRRNQKREKWSWKTKMDIFATVFRWSNKNLIRLLFLSLYAQSPVCSVQLLLFFFHWIICHTFFIHTQSAITIYASLHSFHSWIHLSVNIFIYMSFSIFLLLRLLRVRPIFTKLKWKIEHIKKKTIQTAQTLRFSATRRHFD